MKKTALSFVTFVALLTLCAGSSHAQDSKMNGLFCHKATIEYAAPPNPDGTCPPPLEKARTINHCSSTGKNHQTMQLRLNPDGTLDFGVSVWQNGYNCGLSGKAVKNGKGWRLEKYMNEADKNARCRLDITRSEANIVTLRTDPQASCRFACGVGLSLDGVQFPLDTSRAGPGHDIVFTTEEYIYTIPLCPP